MIDINLTTKDDFLDKLRRLKPGEAMRTLDDISIRRCRDHPGYEFVSVMGHPDPRRYTSADSVLGAIYDRSSASVHAYAYGGPIRYKTVALASSAIADGRAIAGRHYDRGQMSQDKADRIMKAFIQRVPFIAEAPLADGEIKKDAGVVQSLADLTNTASKPSYRSRARMASQSLQNNDVAGARIHLEALITHAERYGADADATAATETLVSLRNAYPVEIARPVETPDAFRLRKTDDGFQIMRADGRKHGEPFDDSRQARDRLAFLNRRARQQAGADEISAQERGEVVVRKKVKDAQDAVSSAAAERGEFASKDKTVTDTRDWQAA